MKNYDSRSKSPGRWISIINRLSDKYFRTELKRFGLGLGQHLLLAELYDQDKINQDTLAKHLEADKANVARSLNKLEALGYIERRQHPKDKRSRVIYLTPKAMYIKDDFVKVLRGWSLLLCSNLSTEEFETAIKLLQNMYSQAHKMYGQDTRENMF
ncbi:MAG: MarR family transcriptional regulator [Lentisphaerae bacterium]|nr:MarR family transcriptional regulator [Lentisphaerota bacterium]MCP4101396.1 MarR family transcriptional regulator [Lentisphaerota bacterium]